MFLSLRNNDTHMKLDDGGSRKKDETVYKIKTSVNENVY